MIDVEPLIRRDLNNLVVLPPDLRPDWVDVQRRVRGEPASAVVRRRRKRPLLVALIVILGVAIPLSALAVTKSAPFWFLSNHVPPGFGPANGAKVVVVKTGTWDGQGWALTAYRSTSGLCIQFTSTINGRPTPRGGGTCGSVLGTVPRGRKAPVKITGLTGGLQNLRGGRSVHYIVGAVVESASVVAIHLGDGTVIRTPTFEAPKALGAPVRFYAAQLPAMSNFPFPPSTPSERAACRRQALKAASVAPVHEVGLDSAGRVVAAGRRHSNGMYLAICNFDRNRNSPLAPTIAPGVKDTSISPVLQIAGAYGTTATLAVGKRVSLRIGHRLPNGNTRWVWEPARCWHVTFSNGRRLGNCSYLAKRPSQSSFFLDYYPIEHLGRATFVVLHARARPGPAVARIVLRFPNGQKLTARPIAGIVVFGIPESQLTTKGSVNILTAYDSHNRKLGRQHVFYRSCASRTAKGFSC